MNVQKIRREAEYSRITSTGESDNRTAINRYYYYCILLISEITQNVNRQKYDNFSEGAQIHEDIANQLKSLTGSKYIDGLLNSLREKRGDADYELGEAIDADMVEECQNYVRTIEDELKQNGYL